MSIIDWDNDSRPREKLLQNGASSLTDAELLAIFLRVGVAGQSAVDLGQTLISHFGSLHALFAAELTDIAAIKGMGMAKYAQLQAVFEMSRRAMADSARQLPVFDNLAAIKSLIALSLNHHPTERVIALFLDAGLRLIQVQELNAGHTQQVQVDVRALVEAAFNHRAHSLILAHNHPHGLPEPSEHDIQSTRLLQQHLRPLGLYLLDHFIVATGYAPVSMVELGVMTPEH